MAMTVMNNGAAMSALGEANKNNSKLSKDLKKVASGMRVGGAGDDAATYSISEKMRVMVRSLGQDIDNAKKGIDLVNIAESGIDHIVDQLRTLKAMAIDSANDHNTDADRATLQKEFDKRIEEINDTAAETNYNGKILLDGRYWYREYDENDNPINPLQLTSTANNVAASNAVPFSARMMSASRAPIRRAPQNDVSVAVQDRPNTYTQNSYTGLFPTPTVSSFLPSSTLGYTSSNSNYPGFTGYAPMDYTLVQREGMGYNFYSCTETEQSEVFPNDPSRIQWKRYRTIPAVGTVVNQNPLVGSVIIDSDKAIIDKEPVTGRSVFLSL